MISMKHLFAFALSVCILASCDESTSSLGVFSETDRLSHSTEIFEVHTRSLAMDSVLAESNISYLGDITDPETGSRIQASFAAQFHTFEDYSLPNKNRLFPLDSTIAIQPDHSVDSVKCDSAEIRLYFDSYYGEGGNPMKLEVFELDKQKVLEEDSTYFSNLNLEQYIPSGAQPLATKMFSPEDYTISDAERESSKHVDNIRIKLPNKFGTSMLQTYYKHPEYFKDSYAFIRNVFPGVYIRVKSGNGTMVGVIVSTLNLYFTYYDEVEADSVYNGIARFAATPEVIQSTQIKNGDVQTLLDNKQCTYLKTPAGIYTEMELPISEIYRSHKADSVNKAKLILTRYNKEQNDYAFGTPKTLLLVRKQNMYSFFENHEVSDDLTSYTADFNSTYNTYTYENMCRLISYCQHEKLYGMAKDGLTEAQWEAQNPDWNKVVLIPVNTSTNSSGYQVSVTHDLGLNSIQLVGGESHPLQMQVIYSRFE